ncbi:insulinase family protein [Actinomadura sp. WMMA1423]|uniref:insulinase family protein n=1 Tax=Actinomadura sp. WMMA1423 TaxID=2591108 RepID=UPI001146BE0B|nr:insulinase family protein [Actinomadura sp. WMMA1423]
MDVTRIDIDGVPVFWSEGAPGDDGLRAALVFRVGRADETLARGGVTHLVEHLALHAIGDADYHHNGSVDAVTTMFLTHGEPAEVAEFLTTVCESLRALPMGRIEAEKNILRTEAEGRDVGAPGQLLLWRYGAATYGLPAYEEHGLAALTPEDVKDWSARWFTRNNAALAIVGGPPPAGLALPLPEGERRPVPDPTNGLPRTPAYVNLEINGVALSGIVPRSSAARIYADLLGRRLHRVLRRDNALSYTTSVGFSSTTGDGVEILAFADGLAEVRPELAERFRGEIERIAAEPVEAAELAEAVAARRTRRASDEGRASQAIRCCMAELMGPPALTTEEALADLDAVRPEDVQDVGRAVLDTALLMLPRGQEPQGARFSRVPLASTVAVEGRVHTRADDVQQGLIVGREGATSLRGPIMATVRFDQCAAVLAWQDGARLLIGLDGVTVGVEPNLWHAGTAAVAEIDRYAPAEVVVRKAARPDDRVPPRNNASSADADSGEDGSASPGRVAALVALLGRIRSRRRRPAWQDAALAAALPKVRGGDLRAGLDLLARTRDDAETRSLYLENLTDAALGQAGRLTRLSAEDPNDPDLCLWLGATRVAEAWEARSAERAENVDAERFGRFWRLLALAGPPLYRAAELLPADPVPWDRLQWYGIGMQLERDELDRTWRELTAREPFLFEGHISRSQALCKKWWGSEAELLDFAEAAVAAAGPGDPVTAVLALAHLEIGGEIGTWDDLNRYLARPSVHAALVGAADRLLAAERRHPRNLEAHHYFGAVFYRAGDHDRARRHLERAGRTSPPDRAWGYAPAPDRLLSRARRDVRAKRGGPPEGGS